MNTKIAFDLPTQLGMTPVAALAALMQNQGISVPVSTLEAGVARDAKGRVAPAVLPDIADRFGWEAQWNQAALRHLPTLSLPVIVLLDDNSTAVLLRLPQGDQAGSWLTSPGSTAERDVTLEQLLTHYSGQYLMARARPRPGDRTDVPEPLRSAHWLRDALWQARVHYFHAGLATILVNILGLVASLFSMQVYDRVIPNQAWTTLWTLATGVVLANLFELSLRWVRSWLVDSAAEYADRVVSARLFRRVLGVNMLSRPASAGGLASMVREFDTVRDFFASLTLLAATDLPFLLLFLGVMAWIGGPLFWVPAIAILLVLLGALILQWPLAKLARDCLRHGGDRQGLLVESVDGLETLRLWRAESSAQKRWEELTELSAESNHRLRSITSGAQSFTGWIQQFCYVAVIVWGVYLIADGKATMGALIAASMLTGRALAPLSSMMGLAARWQQTRSAMATLDKLMEHPQHRDPQRQYASLPPIQGRLKFENLVFSFPKSPQPALHQLNLEVPSGSHLALLGRVGSGKSTLLRMTAGLFEPNSGHVLLDDIDIRQIDPTHRLSEIMLVGQNARLFMGTLRHNLQLGDVDIHDVRILRVLDSLGLGDWVRSMPRGLDSFLAENGVGVSAGQAQLLSIARLLLRSPHVVLLDEPTSHLDHQTEQRVIDTLREYLQGKTLIMATHRPQILTLAENVAVLEHGRLLMHGGRDDIVDRLTRGVSVSKSNDAANS